MGVVVTCSGTGSEMNCGAVITHEAKNWKGGIFATTARFAALDPRLYRHSAAHAGVLRRV